MERFLRFATIGGLATLFQYVLLVIGVQLQLGPTTVISGLSFAISAIFNFLATRAFTFRSSEPIGPASLRYAGMIAVGLVLNTIVMSVLLALGLHYLASQVVATVVILFWNYLVASRWVFAGSADRARQASR
jgi:putative flippase GtrA